MSSHIRCTGEKYFHGAGVPDVMVSGKECRTEALSRYRRVTVRTVQEVSLFQTDQWFRSFSLITVKNGHSCHCTKGAYFHFTGGTVLLRCRSRALPRCRMATFVTEYLGQRCHDTVGSVLSG